MEAINVGNYNQINNVLISQGLDNHLVTLLLEQSAKPEKFYLTGFETVAFNKDKRFALSTVLSSMLLFDKELLIVKTGIDSCQVIDLCDELGLLSQSVEWLLLERDINYLGLYLKQNKSISHLVICEEILQRWSFDDIKRVGEIAMNVGVDVVFVCSGKPFSIEKMSDAGISYMVSLSFDETKDSLVVALRSKLVQVEGRSKTQLFDLHHYWQRTLTMRDKIIEPMAV
ncbi:MAG: hypothetical protein JW717_04545 [Marinilabiliaceae bacterium]|nr:hypothetical protein [Marinilabiliaceae bacterium]